MAVASRARTRDLQIPMKWKDTETSPERTPVWTEPPTKIRTDRKVPVVYYLSRNGQLEHPHFMEVPLSSTEGLYLRDVINRLNLLRGKGMASLYSWSSKRSYKSGFVWHDLSENDFIYPAHGQEYVLKGSELLDSTLMCKSDETVSSDSIKSQPESRNTGAGDRDLPPVTRRRNQTWSAIDFQEYKVYKAEPAAEPVGRAATDASTQTEEKRRRRRAIREIEEEEEKSKELINQNESTELRREEISPPPSDSSPETLETLMKADGRLVLSSGGVTDGPAGNSLPCGRLKTSSVLMQLISCGSISFKDCGPVNGKDERFSLISQYYKGRLPRGGGSNHVGRDAGEVTVENPSSSFEGRVKLEDKEYFSGSLIETKKPEFTALKRSSSYNADRMSQLELVEKEEVEGGGVKAKCIPRKPKAQPPQKREVVHKDVSGLCSITRNSNSQQP